MHHYATDKNKEYTKQFEDIINKYDLDLKGEWNKDYLPHQGRHASEYHEYVLENMRDIDEIAKGDREKFLEMYESVKNRIKKNPEIMYKKYWKDKNRRG